MTASELKKLVTQVRRTDTALRHLAAQLDLNEADKASLLKAASVLSASGRQRCKSGSADQAHRGSQRKGGCQGDPGSEATDGRLAGRQHPGQGGAVCCQPHGDPSSPKSGVRSRQPGVEPQLLGRAGPRGDTDERRLEGSTGRQAGERTHGTGKRAVGQDSNSTRNNCAGPIAGRRRWKPLS
jgi:hypothetical protein